MIPTPLIDWAVWSKLDRYRDIELILLKGHLLLEVMLSEVLRTRLSLTDPQIRKLSFRQKINELAMLAEDDHGLMEALDFLAGLNKLRNRLAHEPFPTIENDLAAWSGQVLHVFLKNKHQQFTARTRITQAMSALAGWVYEFAVCETKDCARSCPPILGG
ncbi:hypothetical protein [Stenotrophomonas pigmentata]|uniref:hypothetical protein n=1 Tax=Stenotrophomonas pigmentata TaxID=3055080 RepID=UPI0026EB4634|nr:hypothetical protein [Stenotrophomonas sp. 610A2]